ncbi:RNA-binding protein [bacterium]|nr:RNA-binding protein [bacterium]
MYEGLFVTNLPLIYNERNLRTLFSRYGEVFSTKLVTDKKTRKSKGYGFIKMSDRDTENAVQHLNGLVVGGKKIVVKYDTKNQN